MPVPNKARLTEEEFAERREKAHQLRIMGWQYRDIAKELGVSEATSWLDVNAELARRRKELTEAIDDTRSQELSRLDLALKGVMPGVEKGIGEDIELLLKIQTRRSKLLGLDAPTKQSIDVNDNRQKALSTSELMKKFNELKGRVAKQITDSNPIEGQILGYVDEPVKAYSEPATSPGPQNSNEEPPE